MITINTVALLIISIAGFILVITFIGVLTWYVLVFMYKHTVEIIKLQGDTEQPRIKKAKDYVDPLTKIKFWKLRFWNDKDTILMPVPPDRIIKHDHKGKNFIRAYLTETGDWIYADSQHPKIIHNMKELLSEVPQDILDLQDPVVRQQQLDLWKKNRIEQIKAEAGDNYLIFKAYTTNHRLIQIKQIQKAYEKKNRSLGDKLTTIMNFGVVVILAFVIIVGIVMWKDLSEPALDKQGEITKQKEQDTQQWQIISDIHNDVQQLKGSQTNKPPD